MEFVRRHRIEHFLSSLTREFYAEGEAVVRRGDAGTAAYVVIAGKVAVGDASRLLGPGDLFGEIALLTERPRTADVTAHTDVELTVLDRDAFHAQLRANPDGALRLLRLVADRAAASVASSSKA